MQLDLREDLAPTLKAYQTYYSERYGGERPLAELFEIVRTAFSVDRAFAVWQQGQVLQE
jgi:hypothetical protein